MSRAPARPLALALDLGSTRIKLGRLDPSGELHDVRSVPAPALHGSGLIRECRAEDYLAAAERLLARCAADVRRGTPLGIATQRSSFVVWDRRNGRPRTPLVSWQDRRAADWCDRHRGREPEIVRRSGLPLSAHYAGPKLAAMAGADRELRDGLESGAALFGTLETFLLWRGCAERPHRTDLSVAARTAMVELDREDWSTELLELFGVPVRALPRIAGGRSAPLALAAGPSVTATIADQAAGALAVLDPGSVLVNVGTGTFVLRSTAAAVRRPGYLTAPLVRDARGTRYALEGTVNGTAPTLARFGEPPTLLPERDPAPEAFALPDFSGLGSPWWRPDLGLRLSAAAQRLDAAGQRRVAVEGLAFRVRSILEDLRQPEEPPRILVAGGLANDPGIATALAGALGRPVELLLEPETTLRGAGRLAAGLPPRAEPRTSVVEPGPAAWLARKHADWQRWLARLLREGSGGCTSAGRS